MKKGRPKGVLKTRKNIYRDEFKKLISYIRASTMKPRVKNNSIKISYLLFYFGFRISEITRLKNKDIHEAVNSCTISLSNNTKTKKPREAYVSRENAQKLKVIFNEELNAPLDDYIVSPTKNKRDNYSNATITKMMNRIIKEALGEHFSTHSFRGGYITTLFRANVQINIISKIIGHASESTTMRYIAVEEEELKKAVLHI